MVKTLLQKDPIAQALRSRYIFKIIPMINPDGVVYGNYRTTFLGKDMNRMFMSDLKMMSKYNDEEDEGHGSSGMDIGSSDERVDERLIPEIVAVRRLLHYVQK
jgi:murein tripeptide amidase MpaA